MKRPLAHGLLAAVVVAATATGLAAATSHDTTGSAALTCEQHRFPVQHRGSTQHVFGELCHRGTLRPSTPVQVLLHGGSYDHRYWDWAYRPEKYSYVEQATRRGFATVNLDRLGYGNSDHPAAETVDFAAGGDAVHQVVRQLRRGDLRVPFRTVVLNGHSMGGVVAENAAAHGGVDAVVVSGIPRDPQPGGPDASTRDDGPPDPLFPFYPAGEDAKFAGREWVDGYLTTRPGTRMQTFHYPGTYDAAMVRGEESAKDTLTSGELCALRPCGERSAPPEERTAPRRTVPTLHVLGRHDMLFCRETEDCATDPGAGDTRHLVPRAGHSINLSKGAPEFYRLTFRWLARHGIG